MEKVRRALETDRKEIVDCILDAFDKLFSDFIKSVGRNKVQKFLEETLQVDRFFLIENEQEIIGTLAISDIKGRAICGSEKVAQRVFGPMIGWILYRVHFKEFEIDHCGSKNMGYIEFVAIKQKFQGRGLASVLMKRVISETDHEGYLLDVVDTNIPAIRCYSRLGFREIKREKVRFSKQKGFKQKIFMEYRKGETR